MTDAVDRVLEPLHLPNTVGRWRALWSVLPGIVFIALGIVIGIAIYGHSTQINGHHVRGHQLKTALIVGGALAGAGLLLSVVPSLVAYRRLKRSAATPPPSYTHFQTGNATSYQLPLQLKGAVVAFGESVGCWFGPVMNPGMSGSYTSLGKEVDREAVNTLLFTGSQIIGLMLGPDDLHHLRNTGALRSVANEALKYNSSSGYHKGVQFEVVNANHWMEMVEALTTEPLDTALAGHLNFGLPYDSIQSIEVKDHIVNPGISIHLKDGRHIRYSTFKKDRLAEITTYLKQFVPISG